VLYVAWGFPPARTGGVHRALATANAFAADGWRVTVLTAPREVFRDVTGSDEELESLVDERVDVVRVPFDWPAQGTDLHTWPLTRVLTPRLWSKLRVRRDLRAFPEVGYGPWRHRIEAAALDLHARRPIDLVVATTNPQVSVTPGVQLHAEHGVPHVVDFRDAWTFHTYSGTRRLAGDSPAGQWEARAIGTAAEVWFVNEALRRWHADTYPQAAVRMQVVMNGYDRDLPAPVPFAERPALADGSAAPLTVGYLGTLTPVVPLRELVEGWQHAVAAGHPELEGARAVLRGYLGYYATPDPALAALVDAAAPSGMTYAGPASKTEVAAVYAGFDVLLLVLGGGEYVTSGKVFEYASTGLPIVSVLSPGNAAAAVLAGCPRWHPATDLSPSAIAAALASAARDARAPDAAARAAHAQEAARAFRRDAQLAPRIAALRELVGAPAGQVAR
jgi:glycosyltransferase involved in cell wall biosynthesis